MQKDRFLALFGDYIEEHIRQNLSDGQVLSVVIEREARALDIEVDFDAVFPEETLEELLLAHENSLGAAASENAGSFGNGREGGNSGKPLLLVHGERTEPLMGIYPVCMADCIGEQIEKASAPVFRVLDAWGFDTFRTSAEEWKMRNINTPEDYRELLAYVEKGKVK